MSQIKNTEAPSSQRMLLSMTGIGTICALLIVLAYEGTLPRVKRLRAEALEQAIFKVLPTVAEIQPYLFDINGMPTTEVQQAAATLFVGYNENREMIGIAIEAEGQGYADKIKVLYGYSPSAETIIGFYVLETKETPGLGDKIEKNADFLDNFKKLDASINSDKSGLSHNIITVKSGEKGNPWEVDGITGATISSRAVGTILNESMDYWAPLIQRNLDLFNSPTKPSEDE